MYAHYINRGHRLDELINMSHIDKLFYLASMRVEEDKKIEFYNAFLGGGE